jgi:hypothetical protein
MGKIEDFIESHTIKPMFPKPLFCFAVLKQNAGRHQHTSFAVCFQKIQEIRFR